MEPQRNFSGDGDQRWFEGGDWNRGRHGAPADGDGSYRAAEEEYTGAFEPPAPAHAQAPESVETQRRTTEAIDVGAMRRPPVSPNPAAYPPPASAPPEYPPASTAPAYPPASAAPAYPPVSAPPAYPPAGSSSAYPPPVSAPPAGSPPAAYPPPPAYGGGQERPLFSGAEQPSYPAAGGERPSYAPAGAGAEQPSYAPAGAGAERSSYPPAGAEQPLHPPRAGADQGPLAAPTAAVHTIPPPRQPSHQPSVYRSRKPTVLVALIVLTVLFEIPALRLLASATLDDHVPANGVVAGVFLVLGIPVLAYGLYGMVGGGPVPEKLSAWLKQPLIYVPLGVLLFLFAALAA